MGLMLVFGTLWLYFFHRDYRFPRALLLIPIGMGLMFLLNSVRITTLILIGNAGATSVALGGFHSQAGWIAFNGVALGFACLAHRLPWISAHRNLPAPDRAVDNPTLDNPTAAYLAPFLAILAAAMISGALSGGFEWMYPLRFVAASAALLFFRRAYATNNWRFGWAAPLIGVLVFLLWIGLDRITGMPEVSPIPAGLAAWPSAARIAWLTVRTLAAVVTVPIAEELAFRGFLLRRLISADFEAVNPQQATLFAVAGSSLAFGLLHGDRWIAGTVAGLLFAMAQKWRGRIGDAVVAHSVANALIAVWVLWAGHWSLW
jgi:exosortase E/protease (VPEID-CTERM system)